MQEKKPIRQILLDMEVGEVRSFPASQAQSASSMASLISFQKQRKYTTKRNRDTNQLDVTRLE